MDADKIVFVKVAMGVSAMSKYCQENQVKISHMKLAYDSYCLTPNGQARQFRNKSLAAVAALATAVPLSHSDFAVQRFLNENMSLELLWAFKAITNAETCITPGNCMMAGVTINQLGMGEASLVLFDTKTSTPPKFHLQLESKDSEDKKSVEIAVYSGVPCMTVKSAENLSVIATEVKRASGSGAALAHKVVLASDVIVAPTVGARLVPKVFGNKIIPDDTFNMTKSTFSENNVSTLRLNITGFSAGSSSELCNFFSYHLTKHFKILEPGLIVPIQQEMIPEEFAKTNPQLVGEIDKRRIEDMGFTELLAYDQKINSAFGKKRELIKNQDIGARFFNAPVKYHPVFAMVCGNFPYVYHEAQKLKVAPNPHFKKTLTCTVYGAAGGRMDGVTHSYFAQVNAYDIRPCPPKPTKMSVEDFLKLRLPQWMVRDINQHDYDGSDVFISDVFMSTWKHADSGERLKTEFLLDILLQQYTRGDRKIPYSGRHTYVICKGFVVSKTHITTLAKALPFYVCDTTRPCASELIFVKSYKNVPRNQGLMVEGDYPQNYDPIGAGMIDMDGDAFMNMLRVNPARMMYCTTVEDIQRAFKIKVIKQIQEQLFYLSRLSASYQKAYASPLSRTWFLGPSQLPRVFYPKQFGAGVGGVSMLLSGEISVALNLEEKFNMSYDLDDSGGSVLPVEPVVNVQMPRLLGLPPMDVPVVERDLDDEYA